ncbi:zinc finger FYVE domain-containing protein 26-like isoform X2 [Mya arenaria]|uniref:zinc finger FYVE domain-containing protein 26-like isoform X2 n=1 Tax=Mya arenaria TaxID=6604 RepID=UPI0022E05A55|nr:zinc finger FYVE domain-containing protein 26-like isoform X2 [Mya arenaria]
MANSNKSEDQLLSNEGEHLFKHFCNNLYLGQWELAAATARLIHRLHPDQQIEAVLRDVTLQPFHRSVSTAFVSSPCHLSWLCLLETEKLTQGKHATKAITKDKELAEFHLLLLEVCPFIADIHLKEIYTYYKWLHSSITDSHPLTLSPGLLSFLQNLLSSQPVSTHNLIDSVCYKDSPLLTKNNKALQMVYVNAINSLLDTLTPADIDEDRKRNHAEKIYKIFSMFDFAVPLAQLPLRTMFTKLIEHADLEPDIISKSKIVSVLVGHTNVHLLEEFCRLDYELETNKAVETYQACAELTEEQRWMLHLMGIGDVSSRWKMLLIFTMKRKRHVLEVILETGLALIKCRMFSKLASFLEPSELQPLKPLLLLLGWPFCYSCDEGKELLETLWDDQTSSEHPAITLGCNKLAYQIDLIQWCMEKARPLMSEDSGKPQLQRAADLFRGLENHSVLYVLQNSTRLSSLDQQEVLTLLQKVPLLGQTDETEKKKVKSVRFEGSVAEPGKPSLEQMKDMAIYTGYCVLKGVMDTILFCADCADKRLTQPIQVHNRHKVTKQYLSESSSETDHSRTYSETSLSEDPDSFVQDKFKETSTNINVQNLYKNHVTAKFNQVKQYLARLQPLTLRVELLENIFSLLFLTHEDLQEMYQTSEYNSDEGDDNKSVRSASTGVVTPAVLSPLKHSSSTGKLPQVLVDNLPLKDLSAAYDVPYLDLSTSAEIKSSVDAKRPSIDMDKVGKALETLKTDIVRNRSRNSGDLDGRQSSISENISSISTSSSVNFDTVGYIANEYLVRDILALLKGCILDVSAAKYHIHGSKGDTRDRYKSANEAAAKMVPEVDPDIEDALCHLVKSSVTVETLQKRITQLERFTSEAHWRYQLVSDEHIPRMPGEILPEVVMATGGSSDEEVEIRGYGGGSKSRKKKISGTRRRSHGVIEVSVSSGTQVVTKKTEEVSRVTIARRPGVMKSPRLISLMLASPVTLLTMSIRKGQFTQTKQILKLFKLENRPEAVEFYFSQAFQKAFRSILGITGKETAPSGNLQSKSGSAPTKFSTLPNKSGLQAIANVAAAGLATASVTGVADEILKFSPIPQLPVIGKADDLPNNIAQIFKPENVPVMILMDLTFTAGKTWDVCNHLMSVTKSHLPKQEMIAESPIQTLEPKNVKTVPKQRVNKILTFREIFYKMQEILNLGVEDEIPSKEHILLAKTFQKSAQHFLCHATFSLKADKNKELATLRQNQSKYVLKVEEAFSHHKSKGQGHLSPESRTERLMSEVRERLGSQGSRSEKPVIHHSMKQLINFMEKDIPASGILALVTGANSSKATPRRNYLLSLYEHCKELAFLVEESEAIGKESRVAPKNYFEVLEEGPLRILGRMMFKKKMAPAKLEKVAAKLSLNLTHIIVYSCCVHVPSKRLPLLQVSPGPNIEITNGVEVHNAGNAETGISFPNAEQFLRQLLSKLIALMKDISHGCNAQGLFDKTCAQKMMKCTEFYDIIAQTCLLQSADLLQLDPAQRKCFYGNLQSLMSIHCFMHHFQMMEKMNGSTDKPGELQEYSDMTAPEQMIFLSTFSYRVGQLGIISLFDLKYQINRAGLPAPSEWGRALEHRLHPLDPCDPWMTLGPSPNSQLLFATTSCCASSPPVQVLEPSTVSDKFSLYLKEYLQACVTVDKGNRKVTIPELILWYRQDFITSIDQQEIAKETDGLIAFIATQLSGEKEQELNQLMSSEETKSKRESGFSIEVDVFPVQKAFMVAFEFSSILHAEKIKKVDEKIKSLDSEASDTELTYSLTPNTLEYIKSDCSLVATLVSLMCSDNIDESLDDAFDDSYFDVSGSMSSLESSLQQNLNLKRSRAASSMSSLDIRSYRYEKLSYEYPTLKRHLLNYIVPLVATEDPEILKGDDPILKMLTSDIIERYKTNILSLHESKNLRALLTDLFNELFKLRKWTEIIRIIDSIPVNLVRKQTSLTCLHDFVICCALHKICNVPNDQVPLKEENSKEVMTLLHRMKSPDRMAHEVLSVHEKLCIEHDLDLFTLCLSRRDMNNTMSTAMQTRYKQIKVYYRITECAKTLQMKLALKSSEIVSEEDKIAAEKRHKILEKFTNWKTVVEWTKNSPQEVLGLLVKAGDFKTAKTWSQLENLPPDIQMEIEESHILLLLNSTPPDTTQAFMILDKLRVDNLQACVSMCKKFVGVLNQQRDVVFIASYMLNQLASSLSKNELDSIRLVHIGSRMILCLPEAMHHDYSHLLSTPRYILEQLIMNMKPELASKAFNTVKKEFKLIFNPVMKFSTEQFNTLVALYAKKSLEFTVIQYVDGDKERSPSVLSTSSIDGDARRESPMLRHSPQPKHDLQHLKRRSIDLQGSTRLAASVPHGALVGSPSSRLQTLVGKEAFTMPTEPPPRDKWVPDSSASVCMCCGDERFSMFTRRHHCRRCGRVVCAGCSEQVTPIKGINARTCDDCFKEIVKTSEVIVDRRVLAGEFYPRVRRTSEDSQMSPAGHSVGRSVASTAIKEQAGSTNLADIVNHSHSAWKLQTDTEFNANLREDFYFEQAPSTSLCISILNLHGNGRECGRLILGLCDDLSKFLKPIAPGVPNPEVDYSLIMSMMKYLLFHAKIKFTSHGDNGGMGRCDLYTGMVDLLGLLVVDNFRDLPSLEELTKVDSVRRLRDKLIADERLPLAMEVSMKCGLDPSGVWVAWGMMSLQSGDFTAAREKFSKCLKPIKDKNACVPLTKVLTDIIDCLESMPGTGSMEIQVLLANPGSIKSLISSPTSMFFEEASMDSKQFQECVFYLKTYGNFLGLVDFHRRHGYYMKAVQYILDHKCSVEVFIQGLLKPSLESGELGRLTDQMLLVDPSLEKWNPYMTASCRYFVRNKLHHVLYGFQIFMKDFLRAGMTCFTFFYQEGAQSYLDLAHRINYLFTAQQHMQAYMDPAHWGNVQHPLSTKQGTGKDKKAESASVRLVKGHEDVSKYIKTIALQIEITKYFQECFTSARGDTLSGIASSIGASKIPTLFGSPQMRNDLAIMILLCGESMETSFPLAHRIIKEYKLGAVGIFTHIAREMAKAGNYDSMRGLLGCIMKTEYCTDDVIDEILGACLLVVADLPSEAKEAENIIKMLRKEENKINAYILCGKLRSAYLMAVKEGRTDDVKRILRAAKSMGQTAVVTICNKWLEQNKT